MSDLFAQYRAALILPFIAAFILFYSVPTLLSKPEFWTDEGVSIDIARSFETARVLDVRTGPGQFFAMPELLQSTGYPVTVPLAGFFALFGYGPYQARVYMLLWMFAALGALYFFAKKAFGPGRALASLLFFASFASFYASGRTVVGEIPGFFFLLLALYAWQVRRSYLLLGFFLGLAVVAKPSVYGLAGIAFALLFLFERRMFLPRFGKMILGALPWGLLGLFLVLPRPFAGSVWLRILDFYRNPYSSSIGAHVKANLIGTLHSPTLLYFGALFLLLVFCAWRIFRKKESGPAELYAFTLVYSALAYLYYLRSPGWLRYMLVAELLILMLLPDALLIFARCVSRRVSAVGRRPLFFAGGIAAALILFQFVELFTVSKLFSSEGDLATAAYVNSHYPGHSVGVLNAAVVADFLDTPERFLSLDLTGMPPVGANPLLLPDPPDLVVSYPGQKFLVEGQSVIASRYALAATVHGYQLYARTK